jgi:hypothetical protein
MINRARSLSRATSPGDERNIRNRVKPTPGRIERNPKVVAKLYPLQAIQSCIGHYSSDELQHRARRAAETDAGADGLYNATCLVSRAQSVAMNVIDASRISRIETPAVPPSDCVSDVARIGERPPPIAAATWKPSEAPV